MAAIQNIKFQTTFSAKLVSECLITGSLLEFISDVYSTFTTPEATVDVRNEL